MSRWIAAALVAAAVAAAPPAEAAKPKPMKGGYDLRLPVPYALEAEDGSHCKDAPEGVSRHTQKTALPYSGKFTVALSKVVGDWVVEVYDAKGARLAIAGTLDGAGAAKVSVKKKSKAKQTFTVLVCNFAGGPEGRVDWTFVPA